MSNDIFKVHEERDSRGRYVFYGPGVHEAGKRDKATEIRGALNINGR